MAKKKCNHASHDHCGWATTALVSALISFVTPYQKCIVSDIKCTSAFVWWMIGAITYAVVIGFVVPYLMHIFIKVTHKHKSSISVGMLRFMISSSLLPVAIGLTMYAFASYGWLEDKFSVMQSYLGINVTITSVLMLWSLLVLAVGLSESLSYIMSFILAFLSIAIIHAFNFGAFSLVITRYTYGEIENVTSEMVIDESKDEHKEKAISEEKREL